MRFPEYGDGWLEAGLPRNFQVFDPLEFLAEVTQHIPDKGQHLVRYFGYYSNKQRGLRHKREAAAERNRASAERKQAGAYIKQRRMSWAALIKKVYEVHPLQCQQCGGTMKIINFIEKFQPVVIEKILRHCGLWKEVIPRLPHQELAVDYGYFDRVCT